MTQGMAPMNIDETIQENPQEDAVNAMPSQVENDDTLSGDNISLGGYSTDQQEDDAGNSDHSNHDSTQDAQDNMKDQQWKAPTVEAACKVHMKIKDILHPRQNNGKGHKDPKLDLLLRSWLEGMQRFLWTYTNINSRLYNKWMAASLETAESAERGRWYARCLREWSCTFIEEDENFPFNVYGTWNKSWLDDEDLKQELLTHLQSIGKFICAMDLVRYMDRLDVQKHHSLKKGISERTVRYWLNRMNFRWTLEPSGQYIDGHEREDVVYYQQNVFLPCWKKLESKLCGWTQEGKEDVPDGERPQP
jgi:hypothetical protein